MNMIRANSVHSERNNGAVSKEDSESRCQEQQLTVKRRLIEDKRTSLHQVFDRNA